MTDGQDALERDARKLRNALASATEDFQIERASAFTIEWMSRRESGREDVDHNTFAHLAVDLGNGIVPGICPECGESVEVCPHPEDTGGVLDD